MRRDRSILSLVAVLLLFVGVGGAVAWRLMADGQALERAVNQRRALPSTEGVIVPSADIFGDSRPVEGATVIRDTLWIQIVGAGTAVAPRRSPVAARTSGVVQRVMVREGDPVRQGDLLVQLDTTQAMLHLSRARAALTRAQAQYDQRRVLDAAAADLLTPEERATRDQVIRAETGLLEAELSVAEREIELELTRVRAPFTGRVADLQAVTGAYLASGAEVLTLVQLDPIHVVVDVLEGEVGLVSTGRRAAVRFNALGGQTLAGVVESVNPRVDPATRAARVTLSLPNPGGRILPGNYAWVSLEAEPLPDRILVPREAITTRGERHREVVFLLRNADTEGRGSAEWNYVAAGRRNDRYVEIVPGDDTAMPAPGDVVLVNGHHYLAHNTPVHLVEHLHLAGGTPGR
jgi:RND family efflux transporter MFP subunit